MCFLSGRGAHFTADLYLYRQTYDTLEERQSTILLATRQVTRLMQLLLAASLNYVQLNIQHVEDSNISLPLVHHDFDLEDTVSVCHPTLVPPRPSVSNQLQILSISETRGESDARGSASSQI